MNASSGTVLLLDDEPRMVKALTRLLSAEGFTVQGFTSPKIFLESFRVESPCCLVLDLAMPEIDGMEVQQRLNAADRAPAIVFLSGHGDALMQARALEAGAVGFLSKPVNDAELLRAVRTALLHSAEAWNKR